MRRLTPALLTVVMFGIIGLLVVGFFAKTLWAHKEKPALPLRNVPMAVTDIKPGTMITADHLGVGRYEPSKLTPDVLLANRVIVGRVAREPIKAAQPIKAGQLYSAGELPPFDIGPEMRAVSVEVGDGVAIVDGIIKPGDSVDVLFTAQGGGVAGGDSTFQGGLTMRLFEGVKVLAINRNFGQSRVDRGNNHVTLELTVSQTNIVVLAKDRGKITLTYNPNGKGDGGLALSSEERVTLFELLGLQRSEPAKPPFATDIYRGASRATNRFDDRGRYYDTTSRMQSDSSRSTQYQLPNSNIPSAAPANPGGMQNYNNQSPPLNGVPGRTINQSAPIDDQAPAQRNAPTAQLLQPRN